MQSRVEQRPDSRVNFRRQKGELGEKQIAGGSAHSGRKISRRVLVSDPGEGSDILVEEGAVVEDDGGDVAFGVDGVVVIALVGAADQLVGTEIDFDSVEFVVYNACLVSGDVACSAAAGGRVVKRGNHCFGYVVE